MTTGKALAITADHGAHLDFTEDHLILTILANKIFRRAIDTNTPPHQPPDIEAQAHDAVGYLPGVLADLYAARDGATDVHTALADWKTDIANSA